jgi:argininosuccinate lyase
MSSSATQGHVSRNAALEIGERLTEGPSERLTETAFAHELKAQLGLVHAISWVDLAHTISLAELGAIPRDSARALIAALLELQAAPASFVPTPDYGDLYTNREAWLAARTPAAAWLGVARARREALTTAYHLTLCEEILDLAQALATATAALSSISLRHKKSLMPDYTYLQAAQPTTFGHYLQSFAWPMLRDMDRVWALHGRVDQCPGGIGSSNGSVTMQNRRGLADRLGFRQPVRHARDAMWQADLAVEAAAVASMVAVNLDRLAEDLMIFASCEFGFIQLADRHARASKIMPQKRNPFALAFVRATANRLIGVQVGMAAAGRTPSGQLDNRLFAYEAAPDAIRSAKEAALLMAECVENLQLDESRAFASLNDRSACATDLVERLMDATGVDFRAAHGVVGRLMRALDNEGRNLGDVSLVGLCAALQDAGVACTGVTEQLLASALDPAVCVASRTDVGGAAPEEVAAMAQELTAAATERRCEIDLARERRKTALDRLRSEAESYARGAP